MYKEILVMIVTTIITSINIIGWAYIIHDIFIKKDWVKKDWR